MNNKLTLRELRQQNNKTTSEVAKVLGISARTLNQYEKGDRRISLESVIVLAGLYDCSERDIIDAQLESIKVGSTNKIVRRYVKKIADNF